MHALDAALAVDRVLAVLALAALDGLVSLARVLALGALVGHRVRTLALALARTLDGFVAGVEVVGALAGRAFSMGVEGAHAGCAGCVCVVRQRLGARVVAKGSLRRSSG